jgi:hypothetical protein
VVVLPQVVVVQPLAAVGPEATQVAVGVLEFPAVQMVC